jgi:flagellar assembly factor FliW
MSLAAALAPKVTPLVIVESKLFGNLTVAPEEAFFFPLGLFGFPECRSFVMLSAGREGFYWLQSVEHSALAFMLVDPFLHFDGYAVDLGATDRADLDVVDAADAAIFGIVTLPRSADEPPTVNLQGPLALNFRARRGKQLAVQDTEYGVRCPLELADTV